MRRVLAIATLVLGLACGRSNRQNADAGQAYDRGLTLDLTPDPARGEMIVEVHLAGPEAALVRSIDWARSWGGASAQIGDVAATDERGAIALGEPEDKGPDRVITLARKPQGDALHLRYRARAAQGSSVMGLRLRDDQASGVGHTFLALPRFEGEVDLRVRFHVDKIRARANLEAGAASSFGAGLDVRARASNEAIAHAVYAAGRLVAASNANEDDAGAGPARAKSLALVGRSTLEPASLFAWMSRVDGVTARAFDDEAGARAARYGYLLISERGLRGGHEAAALTSSIAVWMDADRGLDQALRVVVAHEMIHRYVGGSVRLVEADGRDAVWFSEGFTVHLARAVLFEEGLLTDDGFVADLESSLAPASAASLGADPARADAYVRGAIFAAHLASSLAKHPDKPASQRTIQGVVTDLITEARAAGSAKLPVQRLFDRVDGVIGKLERIKAQEEVFDQKVPKPPPKDAFGPCFTRAERREKVFDLGFDAASLSSLPNAIRGLVPGSAAERAGLRDGALVISVRRRDRREIDLVISGPRGGTRVRYEPVAERVSEVWGKRACKSDRR